MNAKVDESSGIGPQRAELFRAADVARMLSVSVRTVWRLRDAGGLPRPVRVGGNLIRWKRGDLENFLRDVRKA
ncbi:MAG: helix-turn-helix transcriptional regulator [Planctomycetota bacterium]|jgi:predicted DNA-binding transcriptional regulator AlpA